MCVRHLDDEFVVSGDGEASSDVVAEIDQLLDAAADDVVRRLPVGVDRNALGAERQGRGLPVAVHVHLERADRRPVVERHLAELAVNRLHGAACNRLFSPMNCATKQFSGSS